MRPQFPPLWLLTAAFGLFVPVSVQAVPIAIANASFEGLALSPPSGFAFTVPDWTQTGSLTGTFRPADLHFHSTGSPGSGGPADNIPDGVNTLFLSDGSVSQVLAEVLTGVAGSVYTLDVFVGRRLDFDLPDYVIELAAGATVLASSTTPVVPPLGGFAPVQLQYTTTGAESAIGENLSITFTYGESAVFDQVNFDAVSLEVTTIPEPATGLLVGLGLVALLAHPRRI